MAALSLSYRAPYAVISPVYFFALNGVAVTAIVATIGLLVSVNVTKFTMH